MLQTYKSKREDGFKIIEVLIVLAIAGLIMLIVFLAVPALQRTQRNTARTDEAARVSAAVTECLANRNGVKASCDTAAELNVGTLQQMTLEAGPFTDASATASTGFSNAVMTVDFQRKCTADGANTEPGTPREFAVMFTLEPAQTRCVGS